VNKGDFDPWFVFAMAPWVAIGFVVALAVLFGAIPWAFCGLTGGGWR
jgi:hypothetical protein